ncbi:MAG: hypothetical protein EOO77_38070 [Oxalobacteraceae bacterium]|nr:MAG: hypothetical protein EOO77_38070 [Oxalobacteraceae bacterium]
MVAALALGACAKKNNDLAARRNAAGAAATNTPVTQAADAYAQQMGYNLDIQGIAKPVSNGSGLTIVTRIIVNNNYYDVSTMHNTYGEGSQPAMTNNMQVGNVSIQAQAVCATQSCSPYYIMINVTANGAPVKQMAMMKFFYQEGAGTENDIYTLSREAWRAGASKAP